MTGGIELAQLTPQPDWVCQHLRARYVLHDIHGAADPGAALRALGGRIRGAVSTGFHGLPRAELDLLPALEICALSGVGLETTDLAACRARGVVVTIAPVLYDDVADLAVALALAGCRRVVAGDRLVREGHWAARQPFAPGRRLTGMRAGIVGMGRIGRELVRRLAGFRTTIAYTDPLVDDPALERVADATALARQSDVLFMCAAGGPRGTGTPIIGRDVLEALGPRGLFVNVARGWLVDEQALIETLADGRLGAAALDVFDDEPNVPAALRALPNAVLTPHIASHTEETARGMGECVIGNIDSWFGGQGALTPAAGTEQTARARGGAGVP